MRGLLFATVALCLTLQIANAGFDCPGQNCEMVPLVGERFTAHGDPSCYTVLSDHNWANDFTLLFYTGLSQLTSNPEVSFVDPTEFDVMPVSFDQNGTFCFQFYSHIIVNFFVFNLTRNELTPLTQSNQHPFGHYRQTMSVADTNFNLLDADVDGPYLVRLVETVESTFLAGGLLSIILNRNEDKANPGPFQVINSYTYSVNYNENAYDFFVDTPPNNTELDLSDPSSPYYMDESFGIVVENNTIFVSGSRAGDDVVHIFGIVENGSSPSIDYQTTLTRPVGYELSIDPNEETFGYRLAASQDALAVVHRNDYQSSSLSTQTVVHIYGKVNNSWQLRSTLYTGGVHGVGTPIPTDSRKFGHSVTMEANKLAIGSSGGSILQGTVDVYTISNSGIVSANTRQVVTQPTNNGLAFGRGLAFDRNATYLAIGQGVQDQNSSSLQDGIVYIYEQNSSGTFVQVDSIASPGSPMPFEDLFGDSIVMTEGATDILIGAPNWGSSLQSGIKGRAYFYKKDLANNYQLTEIIQNESNTQKSLGYKATLDSLTNSLLIFSRRFTNNLDTGSDIEIRHHW